MSEDSIQRQTDSASTNTISSPEIIPIVFVPGVMGSRLIMPQKGLTWDPDDPLAMASWIPVTNSMRRAVVRSYLGGGPLEGGSIDGALGALAEAIDPAVTTQRRNRQALSPRASSATTMSALPNFVINELMDPKTPSSADRVGAGACLENWERAGDGSNLYEFWGKTRNWGSVCWSFYGPFLVYLENTFNNTNDHAELHPVFACGYDWRSSNRESGARLGRFIAHVLTQVPGAKDVIVVTHSMGGLVLRAALLSGDGSLQDKIRGVVHGAQPTNGAVVCYRRFFTGCQAALDGGGALADKVLNLIMGSDPPSCAYNLSGCPGSLELLPNHIYQQQYDQQGRPQSSWVTDADVTLDLSDVYSMYQMYNWPGLLGAVDCAQNMLGTASEIDEQRITKEFVLNLEAARQFHADIETTAHRATYAVFSTNKVTDDSVAFGPYPQDAQRWTPPSWAAAGLGNDLTGMGRGAGDGTVPAISACCPALKLCEAPKYIENVEHSAVYNDTHFRAQVSRYIRKLMALPAGSTVGNPQTWPLSAAQRIDES